MATFTYVRKLRGYQITLTLADTKYSLFTLLAAIDSAVPLSVRELVLQNDEINGGAKTLIGDVNLSGTRYAYKLQAGESRTYQIRSEGVDIQDFYLRSDTAATLINVEMADF